jgi:type IV fimbrial biogenesis protein FimT
VSQLKSKQLDHSGFTLLELMVVLSILAIITGLAAPSFTNSVKNNALLSQSTELKNLIQFSRSQAMMNASTVIVQTRDGTNAWNGKEIIAWRDVDNDSVIDDAEVIRSYKTNASISLDVLVGAVAQSEVSFSGLGLLNSSQNIQMSLCDSRTGEKGYTLTVLASGVSAINDKVDCS